MLKDLVKSNRSCRGYDKSRKVTREELLEMVDLARISASSVNSQVLKYRLVYEDSEAAKMNDMVTLGAALPDLKLPFDGTEAPAYIAICHDHSIAEATPGFLKDVGIAAQTITLAATEKDLAGCIIGNYNKGAVHKALNLPDNLSVELIIAIGKSIETVELVEVEEGESLKYYRDSDGVHYVPKRKLEDIVL